MDYINDIVAEILNGTFSVFCGAGADCDATGKAWEDIFNCKTRQFYSECSSDLYFLAELEKRYYNPDSFWNDICNKINSMSKLESEHINNIVNLNINQIWTTNFDQIIENTIKKKLGFEPTIIKESDDLFTANLNSKFIIYKLNGSITKKESMILTKSDYFNYFKKQRLLFEILKRQLDLDTFLFVGYSFSDDLVLNALREIKDIFPNRGKIHYRFAKTEHDEPKMEYENYLKEYYYDEYNIKTIYIQDFSGIDVYLKKIYQRFCNYNVFISGSFRYLKNNEERIQLEELVGCLIEKLVANGYNIYSGNGRGLGELVVAQISRNNAEKHFVNRPLIFSNDDLDQKKAKNKLMMKDCDTMVIIAGQDDSLESSQNVFSQFLEFINSKENSAFKLVIPIPSTGYAAEKIFLSDHFKNSNAYLTNRKIYNRLLNTTDNDVISNIVIDLIKSYKSTNS